MRRAQTAKTRPALAHGVAHGQTLLVTAAPANPAATKSVVVGLSQGFRTSDLDTATAARLAARAIVCACCAAIDPALPLQVTWDDLGLYRQLLLRTGPDSWSDIGAFGDDSPAAAVFRDTLETYLDYGGDAARTIHALGIHRTTFYYRLARLHARYQVQLDNGLARSDLHFALKIRRLAQGRHQLQWTDTLIAHLAWHIGVTHTEHHGPKPGESRSTDAPRRSPARRLIAALDPSLCTHQVWALRADRSIGAAPRPSMGVQTR